MAQDAAEDRIPTGPSVEERLAEIRHRVQEAVIYPSFARQRNLSGEVLLEFRIAQDGTPEALAVRRSSGSALLDRAAERAVREAGPLPRLYGLVAVPVRFELEALD